MLVAEHRGAFCMRSTRYMRLALLFMGAPSPLDADDGLAGGDVDVLMGNSDGLLSA